MSDNERVLKSYVWHLGKCFFVSTIERDCSAAAAPEVRYNETIVWEYDWKKAERGALLYQLGDSKGSVAVHLAAVENLYRFGNIPPTT